MAAWSRDHVELRAQLGERKLSGSPVFFLFVCARGRTCSLSALLVKAKYFVFLCLSHTVYKVCVVVAVIAHVVLSVL